MPIKLSLFSHRQSTLHCVCLIQWQIVGDYNTATLFSLEKICNRVLGKKDRDEKKFSLCSRYANNSPWDSYNERMLLNRKCSSCPCKFLHIYSWKCKLSHTNSWNCRYDHFQSSFWKLSDDSKNLHVRRTEHQSFTYFF